jgi:endonuclease/exonuclease/phosphatase family metal-dependent hydrolase
MTRKSDKTSSTVGLVFVALLALGLGAGCGDSETSPAPIVDDNPFTGATAGTDTTFEIVTWNLRQFPQTSGTVLLAAQAIAAVDPDLVALQEIESGAAFATLVDLLPGWDGFRGVTDSFDLRLAILYKTAAVEVLEPGFQELFPSDNRTFPRAPLAVTVRTQGRDLVVVDNHLKCCGDGVLEADEPWDEETRRRDACMQLQDWIATHHPDDPVIVLGDLNDLLVDPPQNNVFEVFFDAPDRYRFADLAIAEGPTDGWSYPPSSHLDHILVTAPLFAALDGPDAQVTTLRLDTHLPGGLSDYRDRLSDHRPVFMQLDLR